MTTINRSALRRNSASKLLDKIKQGAEKKSSGNQKEDARFWQPTTDTNGNGFAVVRFLPARTEESLPYVKQYNHGFQVNNKWFINLCPTTIGEESPAVLHCNELWNSGLESDKKIARERKRKLRYFSNVLVVKDPKNPENEGQVKIYAYGQKIFEKLMAVVNPPEEFGESPRDPFGFFDGCVMKIKIRKKDGYRNYDETTVDAADDLYDGDEDQLEEMLGKLHDIDELNSVDKFKSADVLMKELMRVIGGSMASEDSPVQKRHEEKQRPERSTEYGEAAREPVEQRQRPEPTPSVDDSDDDLAMFASLTEND